jgi:hypothetical protein
MQAITIAIGKAGYTFFAQRLLADKLARALQLLRPLDKDISVPAPNEDYRNIWVRLRNGQLAGFAPAFQNIQQQSGGTFVLTLAASNFTVNYHWQENYDKRYIYQDPVTGYTDVSWRPEQNDYQYSPSIGNLTVTVNVEFKFENDAWRFCAIDSHGTPSNVSHNLPSGSLVGSDLGCAGGHFSDVTLDSIRNIDFGTPIADVLPPLLGSIPASGHLTPDIVFEFGRGDSGLTFPSNGGIQMGVTGGASYKGTPFPGAKPTALPLPAPPGDNDPRHLTMYVSNYEIDALNWAFWKAGKLDLDIKPQDLSDPSALNVSTYTTFEPTLKPYAAFVMYAHVVQDTAPTTTFQTVYDYTAGVMAQLQKQLSPDVYQKIQRLPSNAYLSKKDLAAFLTSATVPQDDFARIESAGKTTAMVLAQQLTYTLSIQTGQPPLPYIKFRVDRKDVLTDLGLGLSSNHAQTLKFAFANATNAVTFLESSIPKFDGTIFAQVVWPVTAEGLYAQNLADLGKTGAPLPIMQGFRFVFDKAAVSVQDRFVSIEAKVEYTGPTASVAR